MDDNIRSFKCCENKKFLNFVCVVCLGVFHPSCLERKNNRRVLEGYRIYCSEKCEQTDLENKRSMKERKLKVISNKKTEQIDSIGDELSRLEQLNSELESKLACMDQELNSTKQYLDELKQINLDLVGSIKTMENDNEVLRQEVLKLNNEVCQCAFVRAGDKQLVNEKLKKIKGPESRILILGDSLAKDIRCILDKYLNLDVSNHFIVSSFVKPNALMEAVVSDILTLTKDFTKGDYVIVMGGSVNLIRGIGVQEKIIENLKVVNSYTNLLLFSVPLWSNNKLFNNFINEHNKMMWSKIYCTKDGRDFFLHFNAIVGSLQFVFKNDLYITNNGKVKIAHRLQDVITAHHIRVMNSSPIVISSGNSISKVTNCDTIDASVRETTFLV